MWSRVTSYVASLDKFGVRICNVSRTIMRELVAETVARRKDG
jgi:hypothetical protein